MSNKTQDVGVAPKQKRLFGATDYLIPNIHEHYLKDTFKHVEGVKSQAAQNSMIDFVLFKSTNVFGLNNLLNRIHFRAQEVDATLRADPRFYQRLDNLLDAELQNSSRLSVPASLTTFTTIYLNQEYSVRTTSKIDKLLQVIVQNGKVNPKNLATRSFFTQHRTLK